MPQPLNPLQKRRIYDDYLAAAPGNKEFEQWCHETADKYGCTVGMVRNVVIAYRELEDLSLRQAAVAEKEKLASLAGATQGEALKTLARGMKAATKKVYTNKDGNIVSVETFPDYATQVRAAVEVLKVQGAYEPTKIHLDIAGDPTKMSNDQLADEIARLSKQIAGIAPGAEGQEGGAGPAVLPNALHEDEGRAGSGKSV